MIVRKRARWIASAIEAAGWLWVPLPYARGAAGSGDLEQKPRLRGRATASKAGPLPTAPRRPLPTRNAPEHSNAPEPRGARLSA